VPWWQATLLHSTPGLHASACGYKRMAAPLLLDCCRHAHSVASLKAQTPLVCRLRPPPDPHSSWRRAQTPMCCPTAAAAPRCTRQWRASMRMRWSCCSITSAELLHPASGCCCAILLWLAAVRLRT
jgi:hypothetical protein